MKEIRAKMRELTKAIKWIMKAEWEVKSDLTAKTVASLVNLLDNFKKELLKRLKPYIEKVGQVYTDSGMVAEIRYYETYKVKDTALLVRRLTKAGLSMDDIISCVSFNKTSLEKLANQVGLDSVDSFLEKAEVYPDIVEKSSYARLGVFKG